MLRPVKLSDVSQNPLLPRVYFSSPSPPPPPEPVKPVEIPPPQPIVIPPPPEIKFPEPPPPPTAKEKYAMTPEIPMRYYEAKSEEANKQLASMQAGTAAPDPRLERHPEMAGDPRYAQQQAKQTEMLTQQIEVYDQRAAQARKRAEIINPAALIEPIPIPPPASTSATEAQEKADEERRKQSSRQGMSASIIAGEQTKDYASSATGTGSLLG